MLQSLDILIPIKLQIYDELGFSSVFVNQNKKVHGRLVQTIKTTEILRKLLN